MSKYITKGFTLVELIVVITILAILWTIAFLSLQDFNKDARDSQRITDVKSFSKWIELYATETWEYPSPDSAVSVTDSWDEVVVKGLIWELASKNARISEELKDPLTWENFEYSLTWNRANYEIKYYVETSLAGVFKNAYADKENMDLRIIWSYNKLFSVSRWWRFVAMPSLFPWNSSDSAIDLNNDSLDFEVEWVWTAVTFVPKEVDKSSPSSVVSDLKSHYEGETELQVIEEINKVSNIDTSDSQAVEEIYAEATGDTTDSSEAWTAPAPVAVITDTDCTAAGWIWVDSANDVYIWSSQGNWFCISPRIMGLNWYSWTWMSWNGWGNYTHIDYQWWEITSEIEDDWTNSLIYNIYNKWQTRTLDSKDWYECKSIWTSITDFDTWDSAWDTLQNRMRWLANYKADWTELSDIEWVVLSSALQSWKPIPALYISDCIDWVKDLWNDMIYHHIDWSTDEVTYAEYNTNEYSDTEISALHNVTYQNRQKYLTAWTQESWSHLPSAFSYISDWFASANDEDWDLLIWNARGEYQVACEINSTIRTQDNSFWRIKLAAIWDIDGTFWGNSVRSIHSCWDQDREYSGSSYWVYSARFVVRP